MSENGHVCSLLLDPSSYTPDTLDLNQDEEARQYWFECFGQLITKFSEQAARSESLQNKDTNTRAQQYHNDCMNIFYAIRDNNERKESLAVRNLLQISDSCLRINGFIDPWNEQKSIENHISLSKLSERLDELDQSQNKEEKWMEIFKGIFAGNVFDWGALVVAQILESNQSFGLKDAMNKIQPRPWLIDNFDAWMQRLEGPPHNCALIFVDNSGVDFICGVMPFARELLSRGTKVILCANESPSLNDITTDELDEIIQKCTDKCNIIKKAKESKNLLVCPNGQSSVCLDLRQISLDLNEAIEKHNVDLVVIEGMARALHTNLNAKFKCESLKLAVIKNKWLANRMGGNIFSVICKYELSNEPPISTTAAPAAKNNQTDVEPTAT